MAVAVTRLERSCELLKVTDVVLSTNVEVNMRGEPRGGRPEPGDPGVALYFRHKGKPIALACDKWDRVADNINAISEHIIALRKIDRYGVGRLEQALAGYQRLLSGRRAWFEVLGFKQPPTSWQVIDDRHKELVRKFHPDRHHDKDALTDINEAHQTAKSEFGV